ncbi:hypothetical protein GALL_356630 [mine drainage metagenome]|uniref:Uncharacterized protein n=1 Tax=mine drainage metagenome TaxID=410659 RepID=A0A1J5QG71_9ZZZZ
MVELQRRLRRGLEGQCRRRQQLQRGAGGAVVELLDLAAPAVAMPAAGGAQLQLQRQRAVVGAERAACPQCDALRRGAAVDAQRRGVERDAVARRWGPCELRALNLAVELQGSAQPSVHTQRRAGHRQAGVAAAPVQGIQVQRELAAESRERVGRAPRCRARVELQHAVGVEPRDAQRLPAQRVQLQLQRRARRLHTTAELAVPVHAAGGPRVELAQIGGVDRPAQPVGGGAEGAEHAHAVVADGQRGVDVAQSCAVGQQRDVPGQRSASPAAATQQRQRHARAALGERAVGVQARPDARARPTAEARRVDIVQLRVQGERPGRAEFEAPVGVQRGIRRAHVETRQRDRVAVARGVRADRPARLLELQLEPLAQPVELYAQRPAQARRPQTRV